MKLLVLFIVLNIVNVVLQTIKSLATVKCGKFIASIVNAVAYGLYTIVIVYTNCNLNLWAKVAVVAVANLIGVYVVKCIEEKMRKDKLWEVRGTASVSKYDVICNALDSNKIPYNVINTTDGKYNIFNCYCKTQNDSTIVKSIFVEYNIKYFASETKIL